MFAETPSSEWSDYLCVSVDPFHTYYPNKYLNLYVLAVVTWMWPRFFLQNRLHFSHMSRLPQKFSRIDVHNLRKFSSRMYHPLGCLFYIQVLYSKNGGTFRSPVTLSFGFFTVWKLCVPHQDIKKTFTFLPFLSSAISLEKRGSAVLMSVGWFSVWR